METRANLRGVRLSAQKGRLVADLIRGKSVSQALNILAFSPKKGAKIIKKVVPNELLDDRTIYHLQPSGRFVIGGPQGDAGLTGRKIIVDTYGGWGAHGGGAFSGKDYSKVDRSAAYVARWIAKSLVSAKLARRALVQLSYAIGVADPLSIFVESYGTSDKSSEELVQIIRNNFDLRPGVIVKALDLAKPIYAETAKNGHFTKQDFSWEKPKALKF